jgi:chemotaxis protein methyltransferase CheR
VGLLQWALPKLGMRWAGFRKVRGQVCKRIDRRIRELGLDGTARYVEYLEAHCDEWSTLDRLCRITISRYYRDRGVFQALEERVLPALAESVLGRGETTIACWSIGSASGEEPYTLAMMWDFRLQDRIPDLGFQILGTEADRKLIDRAREGRYPWSSVKDLPEDWRERAFAEEGDEYCLRPERKTRVRFLNQDVRMELPGEIFHLVLCRNLVCTYYDDDLRDASLERIGRHLCPGGALVIGAGESLPSRCDGFSPWSGAPGIHRKVR